MYLNNYNDGLYNVTVILTISTQNAIYGTLYNISLSVAPQADLDITSSDYMYVQLILPCNTRYNVSAVASLCGQRSETTTIELFYSEFVIAHHHHNIIIVL